MFMKLSIRRVGIATAAAFFASFLFAPFASASIISVESGPQACQRFGLDPSPALALGGVHCTVGGGSFSLVGILNGSLALYVGNSQTPSWNIVNDTGALLTSLTLFYSGALASNNFIDMQINGTNIFQACTATTATNVVTTDANCGSGDKTADNPALPLKMVWSGGPGLAAGGFFNLGTASFAHAGEDAGCISGTATCNVVPEPSSFLLLTSALTSTLTGLAFARRKKRPN
jgi:hypothetical protein